MNLRLRRFLLGCLVLLAGATSFAFALSPDSRVRSQRVLIELIKHWWERQPSYELDRASFPVRVQDPIFAQIDGRWQLVGWIEGTTLSPQVHRVRWLNPLWEPSDAGEWSYHETPRDFGWIANVLLPESKRRRLATTLLARFRSQQNELVANLEPVIAQAIIDLTPLIQERIRTSLEGQREELAEISARYQVELVQEKLVPVIKTEILPIIRERSQPLMNSIGEELFDRVSLWSFAWRFLYDKSPLPQRDLVRKKFERFVEQDAIPVFEGHAEEILETLRTIAMDIAANQVVRGMARDAASEMFHDPQLRMILAKTVQDVFADPEPLRKALQQNWESAAGRRLASSLQSMIEPWLQEAGQELLGTPEEGLTPELVAVLRSQILAKDQRWILVDVVPQGKSQRSLFAEPFQLRQGVGEPRFPMLIEAKVGETMGAAGSE